MNMKMKSILTMVLALVMVFALAACSPQVSPAEESTAQSAAPVTESSAPAASQPNQQQMRQMSLIISFW